MSQSKPEDKYLASSTYGILFFGVPQQAERSLNIPLPASADGENESPEIQALKRDFRWLQESNAVYSRICGQFVTKYFVEIANGDSVVRILV